MNNWQEAPVKLLLNILSGVCVLSTLLKPVLHFKSIHFSLLHQLRFLFHDLLTIAFITLSRKRLPMCLCLPDSLKAKKVLTHFLSLKPDKQKASHCYSSECPTSCSK